MRQIPVDLQRNLMGSPEPLHFMTVHFLGAGPALRSSEHDHGPLRAGSQPICSGSMLNVSNFSYHCFQCTGHELVHGFRIRTFNEMRFIAITDEKTPELIVAHSSEYGRISNFVA